MKKCKRIDKHFLRPYVAKNCGFGTENFDFSYYNSLPLDAQEYLKTFLDEYYHNVYKKDNKKSTLYNPELLKQIKEDPILLSEFNYLVKELNAKRKESGKPRIYGLNALKKILQLQNGEKKRSEENDILNICVTAGRKKEDNMDNVEGALNGTEDKKIQQIENMMTFNQARENTEEELEFLAYLKQNKFEIYLANKVIELIELQENSETSKKLVAFIEEIKQDFENKQIKSVELYRRLYSIFIGLNNIFTKLDTRTNKIIENIFKNIIFQPNPYKQRTYYEEIKGKKPTTSTT
jgi:hypothetical protein